MPEHTSFFSYLIAMFPALGQNMSNLGNTLQGKPVGEHNAEHVVSSIFVVLVITLLALAARTKILDYKNSVIPDEKLTVRTILEIIVGAFYGMMKDMMGPERAQKYFPIIGTSAFFILFSNVLGMIPGFLPPTSNLNVTLACGIVICLAYNYYSIKEHGIGGYLKHLCGPVIFLAPLFLVLELLTMWVIRPVTLGLRLMLNIAVDHLLLSIFFGLVMFIVPIPIMILGTLVTIVQVMVFCLLSSVYITLGTDHEDHGEHKGHHEAGHGHAHGEAHA